MASAAKDTAQPPVTVILQQQDRAADAAAAMAEGKALGMDETDAGGHYVVNGQHVDANGQPLEKAKAAQADEDDETTTTAAPD